MRKLIFNLHLYTALLTGLFVVVLGVTGSIMAFEPEIDHVIHSNLWHVNPQGLPLSLQDLAARIAKSHPG